MESEESCDGSSSNSSTSSENSPLSPIPTANETDISKALNKSALSPQSSVSRHSLSSNDGAQSPTQSPIKSDFGSSSSSSSENEDDESNTPVSNNYKVSTGRTGNSNDSSHGQFISTNIHDKLESFDKSHLNSRNSNSSSIRSRSNSRDNNCTDTGLNISHEDLSDVSDMESEKRTTELSKQSIEDDGTNSCYGTNIITNDLNESEQDKDFSFVSENSQNAIVTDLRQKLDLKKSQLKNAEGNRDNCETTENETVTINNNGKAAESLEDLVKTHDEDALDFEAEEGECHDFNKNDNKKAVEKVQEDKTDGKKVEKSDTETIKVNEDLEEGEVSDEDEKRPEEVEPKPICRFYTRGQCTWGMSCRFLHPGVTDKGNYTMFDLVRPVPIPQNSSGGPRGSNYAAHTPDYHDFRSERPPLQHRPPMHHSAPIYSAHHDVRSLISDTPVVVESAWERGLRTAKEMMRKANKRKEQDMDFEDKKMNLTLSPDELEKDSYYLKDRGSPSDTAPSYARHTMFQESVGGPVYSPDRFGRGVGMPYDEVDPYGRSTRYRELPPHRMPQYEDERRVRPTREVIVQRVDPVGRGDEWSDPWMRSKSPGARGGSRDRAEKRRRDRRSYSSNSSYSSSTSSQSDSSSESSRSPTPETRRRYTSGVHKSPPLARRHGVRPGRSLSPTQRRLKRSPSVRLSPVHKRRGRDSLSPISDKKNAFSPTHKRKKVSPTAKKTANEKAKPKHRPASSSSNSGSSDSSASDSDSDSGSSSSDSSSQSTGRAPTKRARVPDKPNNDRKAVKSVETKKRSPISIEIKKQATVGVSALLSPTHSVSSDKDSKKSRREELLKQLRAVEDAIAKKRSKLV